MKITFQSRFLQFLVQCHPPAAGFTLMELLVTIIIVGVLSAMALPIMLNQANKAKQSEAKTSVGSMNRGQQAYYLEKISFATSIDNLGIGLPAQTKNYDYQINLDNVTMVSNRAVIRIANAPLKAYVGGVKVGLTAVGNEAITMSVLCEGDLALSAGGGNGEQSVTAGGGSAPPSCPANYSAL